MSNSAIPWIAAHQASLSTTNSRSLLKLMPIESVMPSSHLTLCRPLLFLPPSPPRIRVFSSESTLCMRWPKYWSFSLSISPSNEHPGLISFRMDWLDLLAVQGTLKSLLQHHSSKASIFRHSAFFTVQLSHPYRTTECLLRTRHYTRFIPLIITLEFYSYYIRKIHDYHSSGGSEGKESACNVGDLGSVPGSGRFPGEGSGYPLQYSCLENPMQRGSLAGSSPWGCKEAGMTEWLMLSITKKKKGWGKLRHAELKVIFPKFPSVLISSDWCHKIP